MHGQLFVFFPHLISSPSRLVPPGNAGDKSRPPWALVPAMQHTRPKVAWARKRERVRNRNRRGTHAIFMRAPVYIKFAVGSLATESICRRRRRHHHHRRFIICKVANAKKKVAPRRDRGNLEKCPFGKDVVFKLFFCCCSSS